MTGIELEQWRKSLSFTRKEAGQILDCKEDYIYAMERCNKRISALRTHVCWLMLFPKVREAYCVRIQFRQSKRFPAKKA